jgi:isoleucyl-tRNA synthetase
MFCSLVATDRTCSKAFLTHGFVVDKDGRKMSKAEGNGVAPQEIISQYNADVLRMWVRVLACCWCYEVEP